MSTGQHVYALASALKDRHPEVATRLVEIANARIELRATAQLQALVKGNDNDNVV